MQAVQDFSKQILLPSQAVDYLSDDTVLVTKEDLEGYCATRESTSNDLAVISNCDSHRKPMIAMLACLFTSFRVSGTGPHLIRDPLPEVSAC